MTSMTIEAGISFIARTEYIDVPRMLELKAAGKANHGRRDIASVSIGPVTIWIDATADGKSTIGTYRPFLDRKQRAELKRLNAEMIALATKHDIADQILAPNGTQAKGETR